MTEFLTNCCVFAYERHCMTMCTCIILIVNLHAEKEGMNPFMWKNRKNK